MSTVHPQNSPAQGRIESVLDAPLPYVVQALLRAVDEALNMPEPEFDHDEEGLYLTAVARRMDTMRELLAGTISEPSMKNAAKTLDEMGKWLTADVLMYRPLVCDDMEAPLKELESVTA